MSDTAGRRRGARAAQALKTSLQAPVHVHFFRFLWLAVLFHGERGAFHKAAHSCAWPSQPTADVDYHFTQDSKRRVPPVHILLLTDPQIIDQHTYPDLPLPKLLYPLVRHFSDNYLKNVWSSLVVYPNKWQHGGFIRDQHSSSSSASQTDAQTDSKGKARARGLQTPPDAVIWMGDLTDGGRRKRSDPEWRALVHRFKAMFPRPRQALWDALPAVFGSSRQVIVHRASASDHLPNFYLSGNHDVGLPGTSSAGHRTDALASDDSTERFMEHFGLRVDGGGYVVKRVEPAARTGLNGRILVSTDSEKGATHELVLVNGQDLVGMERQGGGPFDSVLRPQHPGYLDGALGDSAKSRFAETYNFVQMLNDSKTPVSRVLLTHVPLFRPPGSSCNDESRSKLHGVTRESSRPLHQGTDQASTYQNMVGEEVTNWLLQSIDPLAVFSGDDHDHCEYRHTRHWDGRRPHTTAHNFSMKELPELTVKSMSMTEGVRRPGFARLSLFSSLPSKDPATGKDLPWGVAAAYTPCLLPDQIGIWTQLYLPMLFVTLVGLLVWPRLLKGSRSSSPGSGYLPLNSNKRDDDDSPTSATPASTVPVRRKTSWIHDVVAVVVVALPFWIFCQTHVIL
ncbi:hypothetical protein BCV70DRAFT_197171 [Testicularia cyperi]|uniref:Calcineurin-like phosphoesterase domain-containing protein n=1 Tax=Testicularia cyperi TaxID=1882483 RepID=A0A317XZW8_9BASI|nr:hypothetical protein BCV70DRAFT_197171 [Testicularia cyperi]